MANSIDSYSAASEMTDDMRRISFTWSVLSDEQMSNGLPFSLLNDEQMSNKVGVEHQPVTYTQILMIKTLIHTIPDTQCFLSIYLHLGYLKY